MQLLMRKLLILISAIASLFLAACSGDPVVSRLPFVYRIDIQQGNQLKQEDVEKLYTGMSRNDVIGLLGKPLIEDPFHPERLDYVYRLKPGKGTLKKSRLTLYFKDDALIQIDSKEFKEY